MSRAYPYRRPRADVVVTTPWMVSHADRIIEFGGRLHGWDYDSVLRFSRLVRADGARARTDCGLPPESDIMLAVIWSSSASGLRERVWTRPLPPIDAVEIDVQFDLPGTELGGRLQLELCVVLRRPGDGADGLAPRRPGSVLWNDLVGMDLQGDDVLLPIAEADFDLIRYPTGAAWHLELGFDLHAQALGSMLLLVNSKRRAVVDTLRSADVADPPGQVILSAIRTDVIRGLVEKALTDEDFEPLTDYDAGTVGFLLDAVLRINFPGRSIDELRRERTQDPLLFNSRIQDVTGFLVDV